MSDILEKLVDLHQQATKERSHYYVASCCRDAIAEITRLRAALESERERCAKVADAYLLGEMEDGQPFFAEEVGTAIRLAPPPEGKP